jgi:hypothetical protein
VSRTLALVVAGLIASTAGWAADSLSPAEAIHHVGEPARVCGSVESANYATRSKGQPTFLNFGQPYPNQEFTALIWGPTRRAFRYAPESLRGYTVCVSGTITTYAGKAQIVISDPSQIERSSEEKEHRR